MKLTFRQIESFVKAPDDAARVILVYGPDQGLIKERSKKMAITVISDLNDPFNVATFTSDKIISEPALFYDEANAQSLMGGNRLIFIKNATDGLSVLLKEYLENPSNETLVIVEADDLGPRSSLRKLCEASKRAAAVPCYIDDERTLAQIIRDMCTHAGYGIDQDALIAFSGAIIGDRVIARNEIEKLILYKGISSSYQGFEGEAVREKLGQININDIYASCGDVRDWSMDKLVYAIADGSIQESQTIIESLIKDQLAPIVILRSVQNHFWRLMNVQIKQNDGLSQEEALRTLSPPLFWKVEDQFKRQLNRWSISALESALDALNKMEAMSKQSGYGDHSLLKNTILQITRYTPERYVA
jgi:DNA polymerase-3 subunit delta